MSLSTQSKSTKESLRKKKWKVMEQPSQSPDWNPIEVLLGDLKQAVHARKPSNIMQVKEFYMGRSKMSPNQCQRLWRKYAKCLQEVISPEGGNNRFDVKVVLTFPGEYYIY